MCSVCIGRVWISRRPLIICNRCSNTRKAHGRRHLDIAEIVQAIYSLEGSSSTISPLHSSKRKSKKRDDSKPASLDNGGMHVGEVGHEPEVEWDSSSSTLNDDDNDVKERKQCWTGGMDNADARKIAKAGRKAAKNQVLFNVITEEDLNKVERALHPESGLQVSPVSKGQGLTDNHTIDENITFNANTFSWGKLRQGVHVKKTAKANGGKPKPNTPQQDNEILSPIFARLRISTTLSKPSKERKSLDTRLRAAILGDLVAFENDQVETMQRMAGYWRYANRSVYNEMVRTNEIWDWATGEKLPEIREDVELDVVEEEREDENGGDGTLDRKTEGHIPENWDDPEFERSADQTVLPPTPLVDSANADGTMGRSNTLTKLSRAHGDTKPDEDGERLRDESGDLTKKGSEAPCGSPTPRNPLSPMTSSPHEKDFQGVKDTRVSENAIRKVSPPSKNTPCTPQPGSGILAPETQNTDTRDPLNRFGALDNEVPAPREEIKKANPPLVKSVIKIPAKPIVKTLAIHNEQDDWRTMQRSKGRKGGTLREQAALNIHAKKLAGGKTKQ